MAQRVACGLVMSLLGLTLLAPGCAPEYRPTFLGGDGDGQKVNGAEDLIIDPLADPFGGRAGDGNPDAPGTDEPITPTGPEFTAVALATSPFAGGRSVITDTYAVDDLTRSPVAIDFNGDGKVDPVVAYRGDDRGILQILLSYGTPGTVEYASLTLDGGENAWAELSDVAAADVDNDGRNDLVAATKEGVVYLHHPSADDRTHVLNEWGQATGELELIAGTNQQLSNDDLLGLLHAALGPTANFEDYTITIEQGYTGVEVADYDNDGDFDIAAARRLRIDVQPDPNVPVAPVQITEGSLQLLVNPGRATSGEGWTSLFIGQHERHDTLDRAGAGGLRAIDLDLDGDLDLISAAADDRNVQLAWFENPGGPGAVDAGAVWTQHRIGSLRVPYGFDVADVTADGRPDVIAVSADDATVVVFVQPEFVADRTYDWYTTTIAKLETYQPLAVRALDLNGDGTAELVVTGTDGVVRYYEPPTAAPFDWKERDIVTLEPAGDVGTFAWGDLDGDGDADLITVTDMGDGSDDQVAWIRNDMPD